MIKHCKFALVLALTVSSAAAWAKLPPPSEEAKAKADEAKVVAGEKAKAEAELLGKTQDRVADQYIKAQKAKGITVKPTPIAPPAPPAATPVAVAPAAAAPMTTPATKK